MHIQILKENLEKAIGIGARFSAQKSQVPMLMHLKISASKEGIYLEATDLDRGVRMRMAGKVLEKGEVVVPARLLTELVATFPLGVVDLEVVEEALMVKAGRMKTKLQIMEGGEFPSLVVDRTKFEEVGNYRAEVLKGMFERMGFALSRDVARPALMGVLWELNQGRVVATDGYRLSMIKRLLKSGMKTEERIRLLLSGDYWKESLKALELGGVETVVVAYHPETRRVLMEGGDMELVGRVIEGEYPPYEAIIPKDHPIRVRIETEALVRAIRAAAIFARESAHIVRFDIEKETLTIRAKAAQLGEYEVGVEATLLSGEEGEIAFNSRYLLDYLGHVKEDVVVLGMSEPLQPAAFYEGEKTDYVHVIMPVRLKGEENK